MMNAIQKYFNYRQCLIEQFSRGDMSKREYLARNLDAVLAISEEPFANVDSIEKALFNYQFYNALAKDAKIRAMSESDPRFRRELLKEVRECYYGKDRATLTALKMSGYDNILSYFVKVRSKELKGRLIEIVMEDYGMILHSASDRILRCLRMEGVFAEETRHSLIEGYINQRY